MVDVTQAPRRYPDQAIALFRLARWLGHRVWPGRAAYARYLARGGLVLERVTVAVPGLPAALDGLRIAQVSDMHGGPFLGEDGLDPVVDLVTACAPDVLAVTGDFVTRTTDDVHELGRALARMPGDLARVAVLGNHDYRERREHVIVAALRRQGIRTLRNEALVVERGGARLRLAGLEDIEEGKVVDVDGLLADLSEDDGVRVLLCHNPDVVDRLPRGCFDLVLSGHSHGGQIVLPLVGSLGRAWMPRHLRGTEALPGGGHLHVNRGVGVLVVPFRFGARAEVTCLTLVRDPSTGP